MRRVCVFCGSSPGRRPVYAEAARRLGREMVERDWELVYGGGRVGLMGAVAEAVLQAGGRAIGVIPHALMVREQGHEGLSDLRVVDSMHERKALMGELSDAFVAMPGGLGTLEELFEVVTWAQLGIHAKPCGLLNLEGYFDRLVDLLDHQVNEGFVRQVNRDMFLVEPDPSAMLTRLENHQPTKVERWLERGQT